MSLFSAVDKGDYKKVEKLLLSGADVNAKNKNGVTALMSASDSSMNDDIVELLLKHGARVDAKDKHGRTALMYAVVGGFLDPAKVLLEHGADVNISGNFIGMNYAAGVGTRSYEEMTSLMAAVKYNRTHIVDFLVKLDDIDINKQNKNGWTALMFAVMGKNVELVELLLEYGAEPFIKNNDELTALDIAMMYHRTDIIKILRNIETTKAMNAFKNTELGSKLPYEIKNQIATNIAGVNMIEIQKPEIVYNKCFIQVVDSYVHDNPGVSREDAAKIVRKALKKHYEKYKNTFVLPDVN